MSENAPSQNAKPPFDPEALTHAASDALNVRRVFGEAYERNGTWVIPVATMMGCTGAGFGSGRAGPGFHGAHAPHSADAGEGADADADAGEGEDVGAMGEGSGGGGGFGIRVRPIGVYVVDDSGVHWRPALDVNRMILGGQVVAIVALLARTWVLRRRR